MPKYYFEFEQYTPEYWQAHRGKASASNFSRIMTPKKCEFAAGARTYAIELIAEAISLNPNFFTERPETVHMKAGINNEPHARRWFEFEKSCDVRQVGLVESDDGYWVCSPDGLVGDDAGWECKCPKLETHLEYLLAGTLPDEYKAQIHGSLWLTGLPYWYFQSFHPEAPQQLLIRVERDSYTDKLAACLQQFRALHTELLGKVRAL